MKCCFGSVRCFDELIPALCVLILINWLYDCNVMFTVDSYSVRSVVSDSDHGRPVGCINLSGGSLFASVDSCVMQAVRKG